ncbi:MAG: hypothetical protein OEY28_14710, partial [Nitrospira sp.]|nr:hypothetical protein [Nitrospira sp.]
MRPHYVPLRPMALVFLLAIFLSGFLNPGESKAKDFNPDNPLNPPAPIFWCPGKTQDQQITAKHKTGCQPLYDKQSEELFRSNALKQGYELPDRPPIKIVELQSAATEFSNRYRNFLSCCLMSEDALREVILLIDSANHILKAVQQKGVYNSAGFGIGSNQDGSPGSGPGTGAGNSGLGGGPGEAPKLGTIARQFTLSQIVGTVARAREDLVGLNRRLRKMHDAQQNINELNDEASARVRLQVQEEEEAIRREFGSKKP